MKCRLIDVTLLILEAHQLNQVLEIAFAFLDCEVDKVFVHFLVEVSEKIRMQVHTLQQLNLELGDPLMLPEHAFDSDLAAMQGSFKDTSATAALSQQFFVVYLYL